MPWLVIHGRDRDLLVRGAELGAPLFTREPETALQFDGQAEARRWLTTHVVSGFGDLALMRDSTEKDSRKGVAGHYRPRANP